MTDNEIIKAFDILDKFEFLGGQRAGRELWHNKPIDVQNKDIGGFLRDLDFLKDFIKRQKAEIERLNKEVDRLSQCVLYHDGIASDLEKDVFNAKAEAIKEFAKRLQENCYRNSYGEGIIFDYEIVDIKKRMIGAKNDN